MEITQRPSDIANYLYYCTDEEFAEVFALYHHMRRRDIPSAAFPDEDVDASEISLSAYDMKINLEDLMYHIKYTLDEIIYSEEIDDSAWWKGEQA